MGSSSSSELLIPMVDDSKFLHGRVDPGREDSLLLVESIPDIPTTRLDGSDTGKGGGKCQAALSDTQEHEEIVRPSAPSPTHDITAPKTTDSCHLLALPSELIDHIIAYLSPIDLVSCSSICHLLNAHAKSDLSWHRHVQENIPGVQLTSPAPCRTYEELYVAHDPHWFLTKYKVWFCDFFLTGKIIIIRYDPRRGCIEGYRLLAERPAPTFDPWEADDEVLVHSFQPHCRLHLDQTVLKLDIASLRPVHTSVGEHQPSRKFLGETPMPINERSHHGVFSNFMLTRPVSSYRNMQVWPPDTIPARQRVRNSSQESFAGFGHKPPMRSEISDQAFRIRRWMEMVAGPNPGVHIGEEVYTYATLDPKLYTPTEEKAYRGIWVGDYSGHGCEFLLMHQPDDQELFDPESVVQRDDETPEELEQRRREERVFRGKLEAIKLTGDPNIPRGEYTFVADDLSQAAYVRTATEERFKGARIVKSRGHIAGRMFRDDKYIESQLIMISPNRLAQYWVGFGHISFYERVDIDQFLSPFADPPPKTTC